MKYVAKSSLRIVTEKRTYTFETGTIIDTERYPELEEILKNHKFVEPYTGQQLKLDNVVDIPQHIRALLHLSEKVAITKASELADLKTLKEWYEYEPREKVKAVIESRIRILESYLEQNITPMDQLTHQGVEEAEVPTRAVIVEPIESPTEAINIVNMTPVEENTETPKTQNTESSGRKRGRRKKSG